MGDALAKPHVGVLGARSLVGTSLLSLLAEEGCQVTAFSRQAIKEVPDGVGWQQLPLSAAPLLDREKNITLWVCVAPIWVLPDYFHLLESSGVRRVVALSSMSRFTKGESTDPDEQALAQRFAVAENHVQVWAEDKGVEWLVLRPTLIYGFGRDKSLTEIAHFIRRFGFFPLFGEAAGLRQPVHVEDVAAACVAALHTIHGINRAYNISGGEVLAYHEMVARIFGALGKRPRFIPVPLSLFKLAVTFMRLSPRYRHWSVAMAERMNRDLLADHAEASRDFGYTPQAFFLTEKDISHSSG